MWIYPDQIMSEDYKAKVGDIVIATFDEYGMTERRVAVVVEAPTHDDCVNAMFLNVDPDDLAFYG